MTRILVVGKSGRFHCLTTALKRSSRRVALYAFSEVRNPGVLAQTEDHNIEIGSTRDIEHVARFAIKVKPDFVVIGPEEPLEAGLVDKLQGLGIPCVGPTQSLARIESSKSFARELMCKYNIPGNPEHRVFTDIRGIPEYIHSLEDFVIKPDGLTGGKGVKVSGEHLFGIDDALAYCKEIFEKPASAVIIEEKLEGEEFSFQSLCDGKHVVHTIAVQDHKRAGVGDTGANTGGMGSYSCADHELPFLSHEDIQQAEYINEKVARALLDETGEEYKGVLYGGFMVTANGLRLIEYNARFGDPEVMNVLPLLKNDFVDVCESVLNGTLTNEKVAFDHRATVCKYIVPEGYPDNACKDVPLDLSSMPAEDENLRIYFGALNERNGESILAGSRALAFVGIGADIVEAEQIAEEAIKKVHGRVFHRPDIGQPALIQKRIDHMQMLREHAGYSVNDTPAFGAVPR